MGTGSFPGVKYGRGVLLTTHPLLVPRSWKSRAIPLPTLWATTGPVMGKLYLYLSSGHSVLSLHLPVIPRYTSNDRGFPNPDSSRATYEYKSGAVYRFTQLSRSTLPVQTRRNAHLTSTSTFLVQSQWIRSTLGAVPNMAQVNFSFMVPCIIYQ